MENQLSDISNDCCGNDRRILQIQFSECWLIPFYPAMIFELLNRLACFGSAPDLQGALPTWEEESGGAAAFAVMMIFTSKTLCHPLLKPCSWSFELDKEIAQKSPPITFKTAFFFHGMGLKPLGDGMLSHVQPAKPIWQWLPHTLLDCRDPFLTDPTLVQDRLCSEPKETRSAPKDSSLWCCAGSQTDCSWVSLK